MLVADGEVQLWLSSQPRIEAWVVDHCTIYLLLFIDSFKNDNYNNNNSSSMLFGLLMIELCVIFISTFKIQANASNNVVGMRLSISFDIVIIVIHLHRTVVIAHTLIDTFFCWWKSNRDCSIWLKISRVLLCLCTAIIRNPFSFNGMCVRSHDLCMLYYTVVVVDIRKVPVFIND